MLARARSGDRGAESELYELMQTELRRLAAQQLRAQAPHHTLQPTALVHEAWIRLEKAGGSKVRDREHFLAVAARAMRSALVDHARQKNAAKRGNGAERQPIEDALDVTLEHCKERGIDPIDLDEALERLAHEAPRQAKLVELRFFGGLTRNEAADLIGISRATAARDWEIARHWLIWELGLVGD